MRRRAWPSGRDRRRHRMHPSTRRRAADCLRTCRAVRRWPFSARGFPADAGRRAEHRRRHLKVDRPSPIRSSSGEDNSLRTVVSVQVARGKVTHHVSAASRYRRQGRAPASTAAQSRARVAPRRSRTGLAGRVRGKDPRRSRSPHRAAACGEVCSIGQPPIFEARDVANGPGAASAASVAAATSSA
jgi:hypothetical protein